MSAPSPASSTARKAPAPTVKNAPISSSHRVNEYLANNGLKHLIQKFCVENVNDDAAKHLSRDDLKELGLSIGQKATFIAHFAQN